MSINIPITSYTTLLYSTSTIMQSVSNTQPVSFVRGPAKPLHELIPAPKKRIDVYYIMSTLWFYPATKLYHLLMNVGSPDAIKKVFHYETVVIILQLAKCFQEVPCTDVMDGCISATVPIQSITQLLDVPIEQGYTAEDMIIREWLSVKKTDVIPALVRFQKACGSNGVSNCLWNELGESCTIARTHERRSNKVECECVQGFDRLAGVVGWRSKTPSGLSEDGLPSKDNNHKMYTILTEEAPTIEEGFSLSKYFKLLEINIQKILLRTENDVLTYDILDTEKSKTNKLLALKEKQRQMKVGEIWQEVLGNYNGFINLKIGHETGLDILSHTKKIAIELKNRTNTDNASSRRSNFDKLANFKKHNPDYICVYANINADTEQTTLHGSIKQILHNGFELQHQIGYEFLKFILGDNAYEIIQFVKETIDKYT